MHLLLLPLAGFASAALLPRQGANTVLISAARAEGDLCPEGSWTADLSPTPHTGTVSFSDMMVWSNAGERNSGTCTVEVTLRYPPGCNAARLNTFLLANMVGEDETVAGTTEVTVAMSTGPVSTSRAEWVNYLNPVGAVGNGSRPLIRGFPVDGNLAVLEEGDVEVTLSIDMALGMEKSGETEGSLQVDGVTVEVEGVEAHMDWDSCVTGKF